MGDQPDLIQCPFNPIHFIERHRMPGHITRCQKNYNGPPLQRCMFNAMHIVLPELMPQHVRDCPDALLALKDRVRERQEEDYREQIELRSNSNRSMGSSAVNRSNKHGSGSSQKP